jgi:hypothetical protein
VGIVDSVAKLKFHDSEHGKAEYDNRGYRCHFNFAMPTILGPFLVDLREVSDDLDVRFQVGGWRLVMARS